MSARFILYLGDVIAILLFVLLGRQSHGLPIGANAFGVIFLTASPFIIGWLLVAPWLGAYRPAAWQDVRHALKSVAVAFIPAFVIGVLLRAYFESGFSPWTFYVVTFMVMLALLLLWRVLYTLLVARKTP